MFGEGAFTMGPKRVPKREATFATRPLLDESSNAVGDASASSQHYYHKPAGEPLPAKLRNVSV